jgi:anaerobic selenocysteine-containing dehydrogenase
METALRAACTMDCPDSCALRVEHRPDGAIRLHGDPDHPFTDGFICAKIRRHGERLRSPDRIVHPLLRDGTGWKRIGWDQALDRCAAEIQGLRDDPSTILHIKGEGAKGVLKQGVMRLFTTLGATRLRGTLCDGAGFIAGVQDFGSRKNNEPADLLNAARIVNWGRDLSRSSVHIAHLVRKARKAGARVLTISPGGDGNAAFSDDHIRIRPGTDRFLAAAAIRRMLKTGAFHPDAPDRTRNWETFREHILALDEADLLAVSDVAPDRLDALVDAYAGDGPAATLVSAGVQRYSRGGENVRYINALAMASGNMGRAGGGSQFHLHSLGCFNLDWTKDPEKKRLRTFWEPTVGPEMAAADPPVKMVWVNGSNIVNQAADAATTARAFERTPFVVAVDAFMNDTAARADLILPSTLMLEQEDIIASFLHSYVQHVPAALEPPGEARDDYAIARELGRRLDPPVELPDPEAAMAASLDSPELNADLEALRREGSIRIDRPAVAYEGMRFDHPDGRARLVARLSPEPAPPAGYPLRLLTLVRREAIHSQLPPERQPDGETQPPVVWTAPNCPALDELDPDRPADLVSPLGRMRVRLETLPGLHPGAVVYRRGDWMRFGGGANRLIEARLTDLGGGAAFYDQYVRLENG